MSAQSQKQFLQWLEKKDPGTFALVLKRYKLKQGETSLHGMGAINWASIGSGITGLFNTAAETIKNVLPTVTQYKAQNKILDAQLKRGEQGLPPLTVADYSPVISINPKIDPQAEAALTRVALQTTSSGIQQMTPFILGGLGLAAFMLLRGKKGRR